MEGSAVIFGDARSMLELASGSIDVVVTSPPYYHLKDYGVEGQIGFGQSLHQYLRDLYLVWRECRRVLRRGGRLCVNIGDQFARSKDFGRYKVIPLHAEVIAQAERLGFDYLGAVLWQKKTTLRTSGGAVIMGSFPYPPNGIVEIDYEFVLIFRREPSEGTARQRKQWARQSGNLQAAKLSRDQWKRFFSGHWVFPGQRKQGHEAAFPLEVPRRLIQMFTFPGEVVLDPFLGSGTTLLAALQLGRRCVGYEIRKEYRCEIETRLGAFRPRVDFKVRRKDPLVRPPRYRPAIGDIEPVAVTDPKPPGDLFRVQRIEGPAGFTLAGGRQVVLRGLSVPSEKEEAARKYLEEYLRGRRVFLKGETPAAGGTLSAYVYLENRLFVNRKMIEVGLAEPSCEDHPLRSRFLRAHRKIR